MGYWEETCAITSLPIDAGEEVVAVVLSDDFNERIENPFGSSLTDFDVVQSIRKGHYNWYGGLEDDENLNPDAKVLFFKRVAWDSIIYDCPETDIYPQMGKYVEEAIKLSEGYELGREVVDCLDEFAGIVCFCMYIRRDVVSTLVYKGWQDARQTSVYYRRWAQLVYDATDEKEIEEQK